MSVTLEAFDGRLAVRLETRFAHAWLIPAVALTGSTSEIKDRFMARLGSRAAEGYAEEDAATLALFDLTIAQQGSNLTDARYFPRCVDIDLALEGRQDRLSDAVFAPMLNPDAGIYPIVDDLAMLSTLLEAGARIIQLRIKSEELTPEIDHAIAQAVDISRRYPDAQLFINDYWQSAIRHGAFGVHLGQEDLLCADLRAIQGAGLRLGVSSHAYWEVARALTIAPSYIACGPVFPTRAKVMPWIAQGIDNLAYWAALIPHPVIAIGGINAHNLDQVRSTGCACASVIQAIVAAPHPDEAYRQLQRQWDNDPIPARSHQGMASGIRIASPTLAPTTPL